MSFSLKKTVNFKYNLIVNTLILSLGRESVMSQDIVMNKTRGQVKFQHAEEFLEGAKTHLQDGAFLRSIGDACFAGVNYVSALAESKGIRHRLDEFNHENRDWMHSKIPDTLLEALEALFGYKNMQSTGSLRSKAENACQIAERIREMVLQEMKGME